MSAVESTTPTWDKPLTHQVWVLTGATRLEKSIGGPTAVAMARDGVRLILTLGPQRRWNQAGEVLEEIHNVGGEAVVFPCDVTSQREREDFFNFVRTNYGHIHGLGQLAAGGIRGSDEDAEAVNTQAPVEMIELFMPIIEPGGLVFDTPSIFSHLSGRTESIPMYDRVGTTKHGGEEGSRQLIPKLAEREITYNSITGHLVEGTLNEYLLRRADRQVVEKARETAKDQTLPTIDDMVAAIMKVAKMAARGKSYPQGHVEWVGIDHLDRQDLGEIFVGFGYGTVAVYIDEIIRLKELGFGSWTPTFQTALGMRVPNVRRSFRLEDDSVNLSRGLSVIRVDSRHMDGHFSANPPGPVLAGWKMCDIGEQAAGSLVRRLFPERKLNFAGFTDGAKYNNMVTPGQRIDIAVDVREDSGDAIVIDAVLTRGDTNIADIKGLTYSSSPKLAHWPGNFSTPAGLIEAGAMHIGATALGMGSVEDRVPTFLQFKSLEITGVPSTDEPIQIDARVTRADKRLLQGEARFRSRGEVFANLQGVTCLMRELPQQT